jgi:hypothetical protein
LFKDFVLATCTDWVNGQQICNMCWLSENWAVNLELIH